MSFFSTVSLFAEIKWETSILKALKLAKQQKKAIVLDLYTDWCGYCKVLKKKVFPKAKVQQQLRHFIPVRLNADEFPNLVAHYQVTGYPSILLLDPYGVLLDRITGLPSASALVRRMGKVLQKKDSEQILLGRLQKNPHNTKTQFELAILYYQQKKRQKALHHFQKVVKNPDSQKKHRHDALFNSGIIAFESKKYQQSANFWSQYLQDYRSGDLLSAYYYRGYCFTRLGFAKKARKDLQKALTLAEDKQDRKGIERLLQKVEK
ncbi:MAG: tetratricopeptide repeat protein [Spirochaetota bacterium]